MNISPLYSNDQSNKNKLAESVRTDQIDLIFHQVHIGIFGTIIVALCVLLSFSTQFNLNEITIWFVYMLVNCLFWLSLTFAYKKRIIKLSQQGWLNWFIIAMVINTSGWGYLAFGLMPANDIIHQTFIIVVILGMTAGANPYFAPVRYVYLLYLCPAFIPLIVWFFSQGGMYILLGICGIIYLLVMIGSNYYLNHFIKTALMLRHKNIDLGTLNRFLEQKVQERTQKLEESLAITKSTLESTTDGILVVSNSGNVDYFNSKFIRMWHIPDTFKQNSNTNYFLKYLLVQLKNAEEFLNHIRNLSKHKDKKEYDEVIFHDGKVYEWYSIPHILNNDIVGRVWSFRDITLRKEMEKQLVFQASHDPLTKLPNRKLLLDRIKQGILFSRREQKLLALMFIDLDNFKKINDTYGHETGDFILKTVGQRFSRCLRSSDTVARFGGDEFVIVLLCNQASEIKQLSKKIKDSLQIPIPTKHGELVMTCSIGISFFPDHSDNPYRLLNMADHAMYIAKETGRNKIQIFSAKNI